MSRVNDTIFDDYNVEKKQNYVKNLIASGEKAQNTIKHLMRVLQEQENEIDYLASKLDQVNNDIISLEERIYFEFRSDYPITERKTKKQWIKEAEHEVRYNNYRR